MAYERGSDQSLHFARVQRLFHEALTRPQVERLPFLEDVCKDDDAVLADVLGMLEEDNQESSLLDDDHLALTAQEVLQPAKYFDLDQEIGPYRLIRMIGEGGMGFVYLAERSDFKNPVAIKFLRDAWLSPLRRERFLSEQRLLAPLNHPSIAQFYDAGTFGDRMPWFAMEYVDGVPLTDYCREAACTLEQRLLLFRAVCEAVRYAHDHAVIHRDLKPSNMLVKKDGSVRLLDFGIAKQVSDLQDSVEQTGTLFRMMTPAYASPEQICGEPVGVSTDVYALGVILWELMVGRALFDPSKGTPGAAGRSILEEERERPSVASRAAPCFEASKAQWADLDVICLTATQNESLRRYRSVEALIRDVDRFLRTEPLEARSDSASYKFQKFLRRNRRPVVATLAVLCVVIGLVAFFLIRLTRAKNEALAQAERSERIKTLMEHLFTSEGQSGPSIDLRAIDLIDRGSQDARSLEEEPRIQSELFFILGGLYEKLGKFDRAAALLNPALTVQKSEFGMESKEVADTLVELASVRGEQDNSAEALSLARKGMAIQARLLGTESFDYAGSRTVLGRILVHSGDYKSAIRELTEAVQTLSRPNAPTSSLFLALDNLTAAYSDNGQFALAEGICQKALALARQIYKSDSPFISGELVNLGSIAFSRERYPEAEKYQRMGLEGAIAWYGPNNSTVATESSLLGQTLLQEGRTKEGEVLLRRALEIHEKLFGEQHQTVVRDLNALALAAQRAGKPKEAEKYFERVLAIQEILTGGRHPNAVPVLMSFASLERNQKQYARAEELGRKALATAEQVLPPDHIYFGGVLLGLGKTLFIERRFREAEPYLIRGYTVISKAGAGSMTPLLQQARKTLAENERALGKTAEANKYQAEFALANQ